MSKQKTDYQIRIIEHIKKLRLDHSQTQQDLARVLCVSNGHMGEIESENFPHKYTLTQLNLLAGHFNVSVESFFLKRGEKTINTEECLERVCRYMEGEK